MILPTKFDGTQWYSADYTLNDATYTLEFYFNGRMGSWFINILDDSGDPIVSSIRLVPSWSLLDKYSDTRLPGGLLYVYDSSGTSLEPGLNELGDGRRCQLTFFTLAELGL